MIRVWRLPSDLSDGFALKSNASPVDGDLPKSGFDIERCVSRLIEFYEAQFSGAISPLAYIQLSASEALKCSQS
jgi:hypothetical protein